MNNPYTSKDFIINSLTTEERKALKFSLLGKTIKIIVNPEYGLFTEEGFPVAIGSYEKKSSTLPNEFYAKVIEVEPMVTIYELP